MLVLTRKAGQKIHIGSNITLTVIEVGPGRIRIGIDAPEEVPIVRAELNPFLEGAEPAPLSAISIPRK
jgi:carbon storage regulator